MSTGITFGSYHTSDDLGLSMTDTPPNVGSAEIAENYIFIPGGLPIDASAYPGNKTTYKNREMTFEFAKKNADMTWPQVASKAMNAIHGQSLYVILDDDPAWRYKGRVKVQPPNLEDKLTKLTVNVTALPYKEYVRNVKDVWQWDTTDFDNDVTLYDAGLSGITLDGSEVAYPLPACVCDPTVTVTLTLTEIANGASYATVVVAGKMYSYHSTGTYTATNIIGSTSPRVAVKNAVGTMTISLRPRSF